MADTIENLKNRPAYLESKIEDAPTKQYFLRLPGLWLGDVERKIVPEYGIGFTLNMIDQAITEAEKVVAKYGPDVRIVGR